MDDKIKEIVIDLGKSTYPNINHDAVTELIQQEAIVKIKKLIDKTLAIVQESDSYEPSLEIKASEGKHFRRRHEAITVLGERGTGKTNFLINLKNILYEEKYKKLIFLKTLDPTLFEDRQNILIAIISMIHIKVEEAYKNKNFTKEKYDKWRHVLGDLAEGLNLLDGVGHNPMKKDLWDDALIILDKGLIAAKSGYGFEKNFHIFIYKSLDLLGGEMFILRLDDIDTNIDKGWPVLEIIRKYLTTPHLQVIISGDWKLYSKIVRIKQWDQLAKLKKHEDKNLVPTIDSLEEQYLSKILKPSNRVFLKSIKSIVHSIKEFKYDIIIEDKEKGLKKNIKEVYSDIFNQVFSFPNIHIETYSNLLMGLPIRTNIQVLTTYVKSLTHNSIDKKLFIEGVINTFLTVSERSGFSYKDFQKIYDPIGYTFLATRLYKNEQKNNIKSSDILAMEPYFENNDLNIFMMLMSLVVVDTLRKYPNRIIDWFYRIEYLELIKKQDTHDMELVMQYLEYTKRISVYENVIKINGLMHQNSKISGFTKFYIHQNQVPKKLNHKLAYNEIIVRINKGQYSDIEDVNKLIILLLSIATKKVIVKKEASTNMYSSFHYLLSLLGRLLAGTSSKKVLMKISEDTKIFALSEKNQDSFVFYGQSIFKAEEMESQTKTESSSNLLYDLDVWVEKKVFLDEPSLVVLRNIWNEFVFNEESISNCTTLQEYLETQLYMFLNAILKAESKEKNRAESYENIYNKQHARTRFLNNFLKLRGEKRGQSENHDVIRNIIKNIKSKIDNKEFITLLEYFTICPLWDYYAYFNEPKEIITKQGKLETLDDLGGRHYFQIFEHIALHTEGKSSETNNKPNLTFKQIATKAIEDNIDLVDKSDLNNSLETIIRNNKAFKESKFRWSVNRLSQVVDIFNHLL